MHVVSTAQRLEVLLDEARKVRGDERDAAQEVLSAGGRVGSPSMKTLCQRCKAYRVQSWVNSRSWRAMAGRASTLRTKSGRTGLIARTRSGVSAAAARSRSSPSNQCRLDMPKTRLR